MKNEKKFLSKKRKNNNDEIGNNNNNEQKDNNRSQINNESNINTNNIIENNLLTVNEKTNNDSIKKDSKNNNILFKKDIVNNNNNNTSSLFTFNKGSFYSQDIETNVLEKNNENKISKTSSINFTNNVINTENNTQLKKTSINNINNNLIDSKNKNVNSDNSDNSEDSHSSSHPIGRGVQSKVPKFKSHSQNTRNTAFGLKEISKRVMEIIKQSGQTTYKAISDQIVNEINEKGLKDEKQSKDGKNIRRRIYDSLNVMKSMKLFQRDQNTKTIKWNYDQEFDPLNEIDNKNDKDEKNEYKVDSGNIIELKKSIKEKKEKCNLLNRELKGLKNVLERNNREDDKIPENNKLYFPFIVIEFQTNIDPKINVALNENQTKAHFGFDDADAMYGDLDMVSKIGNHPNFAK